jgi:hypothetical protein
MFFGLDTLTVITICWIYFGVIGWGINMLELYYNNRITKWELIPLFIIMVLFGIISLLIVLMYLFDTKILSKNE